MSYWGAQVIVSLFGAIPVVGDSLMEWIRGDYFISDITLNRFFALHVIALPLVLVFLVIAHLMALHEVGSNNPDGVEIKKVKGPDGIPLDGIAFHPYYTVKDLVGVGVFLILFSAGVFFAPTMGGYFLEHANFEPANPLQTPPHIAPVWYFTPFYAILRAVPSKSLGAALMGLAVVLFLFLPWLDRGKVKSIRYRGPLFKFFLVVVRDQLRGARLPRPAAADAAVHEPRAAVHGRLLRVLPADAVVLERRQDQARAHEGHLPCALSSSSSRPRCCPGRVASRPAAGRTSTRPTSTSATRRRCSAARRTSSTTASAATRPSTSATTAWRPTSASPSSS